MQIIQIVAISVQIALVLTALWYAYETHLLRQDNQKQLGILKKQFDLFKRQQRFSLIPFLIPSIIQIDKQDLIEKILLDEDLTEREKNDRIKNLQEADVLYAIHVKNATDKIATHVEPYIYDPRSKSFLASDHGAEFISAKGEEIFQVTGPYYTLEEIKEIIVDSYQDDVQSFLDHLILEKEVGYIALFYRDLEGVLHFIKREFILKKGDIFYRPTKLLSL